MTQYKTDEFLGQKRVALLDDDGRPVCFYIVRNADINYGDVYAGRVMKKGTGLKAYFVDIGRGDVFVQTPLVLTEGQSVTVRITKESRPGKIPTAILDSGQPHKGVMDISGGTWSKDEWEEALDEAILPVVYFADQARLVFERTQAFWSIDVDSNDSILPLDKINAAAIPVIARQIVLKNLSGNILIDFIGKKGFREMKSFAAQLADLLKNDPVPTQVMGVSNLGLIEIRRDRRRACLVDTMTSGTAYAYRLFEEILSTKKFPIKVAVSPELGALLQQQLKSEWDRVVAKTGGALDLKVDPAQKLYEVHHG